MEMSPQSTAKIEKPDSAMSMCISSVAGPMLASAHMTRTTRCGVAETRMCRAHLRTLVCA